MAKDFRATQIETTKIILSGGLGQNGLGGIIYSGSVATDREGGIPASMLANVGEDVYLFISGNIDGRGTSGVVDFGGDVVHSGAVIILDPGTASENLKLVRGPSGNNYITFEEADGQNVGQIYANSANLFIKGNAAANDVIFRVGGANVLRMDGDTERIGIGNDLSQPTHMLHVSGTQFTAFRVDSGLKSSLIDARDVSVYFLSGGDPSSFNEASGNDVGFYVSGSRGGTNRNDKGIALFGGDLVVSGGMITQTSVYRNTNTKNANFTVIPSDHFLFIDSNAGHVTASLQAASQVGAGRELIFKDIAGYADVNNIVLRPNGSDNIEGINDDLTITVPSGSIHLVCDGVSNYYVYGERS